MSAAIPFAIDVLQQQAALLRSPGIAPETELSVRLSVVRVRCAMDDMAADGIADAGSWKRLGDLVNAILNPTNEMVAHSEHG